MTQESALVMSPGSTLTNSLGFDLRLCGHPFAARMSSRDYLNAGVSTPSSSLLLGILMRCQHKD